METHYTGNVTSEGGRLRGLWTKITWSSIFAGLVVAIIMHFLLSLLGLGIGMAAIQPMQQNNPMEGLGIGAIIWWFLSILISVFSGGYVAGRWAGATKTSSRAFHGVLSWCLFTIFSFYLLTTTIGGIIGGVGNILGQTLSLAGTGLQQVAPMIGQELNQMGVTEDIRNEFRNMLGGTTGGTSGRVDEAREIMDAYQRYRQSGSEEDRQALAREISARTGMSTAEADAEIQRLEGRYEQNGEDVEMKARQVGEDVSDGIAQAAFITFFALILGAGAAAWGAGLARRDIETHIPRDATTAGS
jgi:hypothetical protein